MNTSIEKEKLEQLLDSVEQRERVRRNRLLLATVVPVILCVCLLYYFTTRIIRARNEVLAYRHSLQILKLQRDSIHTSLVELQQITRAYSDTISAVQGVYNKLAYNFKNDFGWSEKDLVSRKPKIVLQSKQAHDSIISYLRNGRVNVETVIRYYTKKTDKGKIDITLQKCGFRKIYVFNSNYYDSIPTNSIRYSTTVSEDDIKLIAYALIRVGIDIKSIEPYPAESELNGKTNSIEIAGDKSFVSKRGWTIAQIQRFVKSK